MQRITHGGLAEAVAGDSIRLVSAISVFEASIVAYARLGSDGCDELDLLLARISPEVMPFEPRDLPVIRSAYQRFGKGRHPAGLNFGDCFAYALAKSSGEPILFKGEDFGRTDLEIVPWSLE